MSERETNCVEDRALHTQAVRMYKRVINIDEDDASAHYNLGHPPLAPTPTPIYNPPLPYKLGFLAGSVRGHAPAPPARALRACARARTHSHPGMRLCTCEHACAHACALRAGRLGRGKEAAGGGGRGTVMERDREGEGR